MGDLRSILGGDGSPTPSEISYAYNGLGDRYEQTVSSITTTYILDLNTGLTQVLEDGDNAYLYGLGRIAQVNAETEYFMGDALGSVRQLVDGGDIILAKSYVPYGEDLYSTGSGESAFAYTGEQTDPNGLVYLRARYYGASDGRFLSRDTWTGDVNKPLSLNYWNYVEGNPVNFIDPSGHIKEGMQAKKAEVILQKLELYGVTVEKDWGYTLIMAPNRSVPPFIVSGIAYEFTCGGWEEGLWTVDQLSTVLSSYNKIRNRLNTSETEVARIMGDTTFVRVNSDTFSDNAIADANLLGRVRLSESAFRTGGLPKEWFVLHELGHIFDFNGNWNMHPQKIKSYLFVKEFQGGFCMGVGIGCNDVTYIDSNGDVQTLIDFYHPSDNDTTTYGQHSSVEDFADSFAVTILFNAKYRHMQSQKRIDLVNQALQDAINASSP